MKKIKNAFDVLTMMLLFIALIIPWIVIISVGFIARLFGKKIITEQNKMFPNFHQNYFFDASISGECRCSKQTTNDTYGKEDL